MTGEYKPLLKNTGFLLVWSSQILSQLTIHIMNFLLITKLFNQTGSSIATSLLWVSYALPAIVVGPLGAAASDMIDRRKVLVTTNILQAVTIFFYALTQIDIPFLPYGVVLTYSVLNQFYVPAEAAALPSLVPKKLLSTANGLFFITQQGAVILGFGFAGLLNHLLGFTNSLYLCASFLFLAFISVSFLPKLGVRDKLSGNLEETILKFFSRILDGYNFIKENKKVLVPFILLVAIQVAAAILTVNVPAIATDIMNLSINYAGVLVVVPAGIGAGIGSVVFPKLLGRGVRKRKVIETSLQIAGLSFALLALAVPTLFISAKLPVAALSIFLMGLSFVGIVIPSQTFLQEATPGGLRGRVFGNYWFIVTIVSLLPVVFSGALVEILGITTLLLVLGFLCFLAVSLSRNYAYRLIQTKK